MQHEKGRFFNNRPNIRIDASIEIIEIDLSCPRLIRVVPVNTKGQSREYVLKITSKGGVTLV